VNWDTTAVTSSPLTAASGVGYFIDTSGGAITVNLPVGVAGAIISLADYTNTWQTNNVTVTPNGSEKIGGVAASANLNTEGQSVTFIYTDGTIGWKAVQDSTSTVTGGSFVTATGGTITTCGDYKIHTFTSPGTFCVSAGAGPLSIVDYMVVAGGGGGGGGIAGGGGAGGFRESVPSPAAWTASPLANSGGALPVSVQGYPITVGGGGAGQGPNIAGVNGSNSVFSTITSTGGGGGAGPNSSPAGTGGSGGGGGGGATSPINAGGTGNTPPVSPPQGNTGGIGRPSQPYAGAGGGGAGALGVDGNPSNAGPGGNGVTTTISGSPTAYAGGGGGGAGTYKEPYPSPMTGGTGGTGGGGAGKNYQGPGCGSFPGGTAGSTNTGGGGGAGAGGAGCVTGNNGGSGIVIIRYKFQ
jgi:hypothetical protein